MGRPRLYATATERQRAHRQKQKDQDAATARLMALQDDAAHTHVVVRFGMLHVQKHATAEQLQLQAERKERDMLDALWTLQTLIADFGYDAVYTHVLQHLRPTPRPCATTSPHTTQRDTDCCSELVHTREAPRSP